MNNIYTIKEVMETGNPLDDGTNFKCIKCNKKGEMTYQAKQWLGDMVFEVIDHIREYEDFNFGEFSTDYSDPEKVVNMYAYIIGEEIVQEYLEELEEEEV